MKACLDKVRAGKKIHKCLNSALQKLLHRSCRLGGGVVELGAVVPRCLSELLVPDAAVMVKNDAVHYTRCWLSYYMCF